MLTSTTTLSKPWINTRDPYSRVAYFLTYSVVLIGIALGAVRCYTAWRGVLLLKGNLCPVLDEDFTNADESIFGENGIFFREVDMSGFGNGEFEMTTSSPNNSFVKDGHLYIYPTLTSDDIGLDAVLNGYVYNISDCTYNITQGISYTELSSSNSSAIGQDQTFDASAYYRACSAISNSTTGQVINPVQSARLTTRKSASIKYGRVEVRAKIPTGDWLWPAIWLMPVDNVYGPWPVSGEIDMMESRGNPPSYRNQGTDYVRGSLNWGPTQWLNAVAKSSGIWTQRRNTYDNGFHTYGLEWTPEYIRIYVDSRLSHMIEMKIKEPFWELGNFPPVIQNGSESVILTNPWINGTKTAPFDQNFYLILDVGVGGTNGWFPDGDGKPWLDGSTTAMRDFVQNQDQWYPSWGSSVESRSMVIDYVKMWQLC